MRESQKSHSGKVRSRSGKRAPTPKRGAGRSTFRATAELLEQRLLPSLSYSTYLGGSHSEQTNDIATDSLGNTYVIGTSKSAHLAGVDTPDTGTNRAFLTKFTPAGQLVYTTILGPTPKYDASGYAESNGRQVVVGPDDLPLVCFETFETNTHQSPGGELLALPGPPYVLHVKKLGEQGQPLFDTIMPVLDTPGVFDPIGFYYADMAADVLGDAYVTYTAIRPTPGGVVLDAFLTRVFDTGEISYTEFLDGPVSAIAVDGQRNLYLAQTISNGTGVFTDVWIERWDRNHEQLLAFASLGGARDDFVSALAADPRTPGFVYLVGRTESDNFPLKNPFQTHPTDTLSGSNGFVTLLDLNKQGADQLVASTYFGGSRADTLSGIALDFAGNVYVAGSTNSPDLPTAHAMQAWTEATYRTDIGAVRFAHDLVVAKFDSALTRPEFSTYVGGKGDDFGAALAVDDAGTIHVAATSVGRNRNGTTGAFISTADFPIFPASTAYQPVFGGPSDGFVAGTDAVVFAINQRSALVGRGLHAIAGREFTHAVAEFTSPRTASLSDFTVSINWGDGASTSGFVTHPNPDSRYFVHGTHQYDKPGAYPVTVSVTDSVTNALSPIRSVNVSQSAESQIGGAIAVDPTIPTSLFAAMVDYQLESGFRVATSDDSGATWSPRIVAAADDTVLPPARGPADVLFDRFGNLFLAYQGAEDNIVVAWSTDGGRTFKSANTAKIAVSGAEGIPPGTPRLAFGAARNEVWVTYETNSVVAAGAIVGGLGHVGGFREITVSDSAGGRHSDIAVGPDGTVAVVWQTTPAEGGTAQLRSSVSVGGLDIFTIPERVHTSTTTGVLLTPAQPLAVPLGAQLAWDTSPGPHRGRLYATYVDLVEGLPPGTPELTLFVTSTDDLGDHWSTPQRVTSEPLFQSMFQPSIAIDPMSGVLAVGWYGTSGAAEAQSPFTGYFVATSRDGKTFSHWQRVNVVASNAVDPGLSEPGSYGAAPVMAFYNGRLYPIWSDNSGLEGGNYSPPQFEIATRVVGVIDVKEAPPAIRPIPIEVIKGQLFIKPVATFTLLDPAVTAANFTARISWGDKIGDSSSEGAISQPGGPGTPFVIEGTHTYAEAGAYPLAVAVTDVRTGTDTKSVSNVSAQQGSQGQPTIAIDPSNPNRVFAAWTDRAKLQTGIPVATSDDGGVTWHRRVIADGNDGLFLPAQAGHAVFDQFGNLFLTYVTRSPIFNTVVLSSKDGGKVFTLLRRFETHLSVEPSIAVGPGEGGQGGSVWLTWAHGPPDALTIEVAGAEVVGLDQFLSFSQHALAPVTPDGLIRIYGDIAVGPQGQVLVTYSKSVTGAGPAEIMVQLDPDGAGSQPFGPPVRVTDTNVGPHTSIPPQAISAIDAEGSLAWDRSDGEHRGRVYLIYTDAVAVGDPDTEILLRYSDNNGASWSAPTSIDNTTKTSFLPSIAVDQTTGTLAMAWYDSEDDASPVSTSTVFAVTLSSDGGQSHGVRFLVNPGPSYANSLFVTDDGSQFQYGRFTGLAFVRGIFQPIWTDNSLELDGVPDPGNFGNFEIANARIAVAEVTREPLVVQMVAVNDREGNLFTRQIATFTDPNGGGTAASYKAKIDWGDGKPPSDAEVLEEIDGGFSILGTHDYEKFGHFPISVTIKGNRTKGAGTVTALIENAPVFLYFGDIFQEGGNPRVVRETEFTKVVATFIDLNPHSKTADFDPTIDWGDGFSTGTLAFIYDGGPGEANYFTVTGTHKYLSEQTFDAIVSIREKSSGIRTDQPGSVISGDPPLEIKPGDFLDIEALEGINTGDLVLAKFTVPDDIDVQLQSTLGEYTATISWGDGEVDVDIIPYMTSEDVTVVGRHTYASAGEYYPYITVVDDSGGFYSVQLIALVEPDVTSQVRAPKPALTYNPITQQSVGDLVVTNASTADIAGPLFVVIHDLPPGVTLESFTAVDGEGNPIYKVNQSKLPAGASLPPIPLKFRNPGNVLITYTVQVFDGLRPTPVGGAGVVFEPNLGQADEAASFIARGQTYAIGLSAGHASLVLEGSATQAGAAAVLELVGANLTPASVPLDPQPGVSNYFLGQTAITHVPHFGRVRYSQVYAGIDIEYYGRDGLLEYDWIVHPGVDPRAIAVRFVGVDDMVMDSAGNLRLAVNGGELVQRAPYAYQVVGGARVAVAAAFDEREDGTVGFTVGAYDPSLVLVIDPVLVYSTYLGGGFSETGNAVAVDAAGNTYVTGVTGSIDFFTVNPFDPELNQPDTSPFGRDFDAFVSKFDAHGVLVYSTYLGGGASGFDPVIRPTTAESIAVDAAGHAWVAGLTYSMEFPTTVSTPDAIGPRSIIGIDGVPISGYLTGLSSDGSSLVYSSVFNAIYAPNDIAVDDAGMVYAAGNSAVFALDPVSNTVSYVRFIGGGANGIAVDSVGQAYIAGTTTSSAFPTKNALFPELHNRQADERNNPADAIVVKLSSEGDVLFSTYLGGRFSDAATDIAVDDTGVIHVVGQTGSDDLPAPGGLDTSLGGSLGNVDGFLIKLANDGSSLLYGTYLGGSRDDWVTGVAVDAQGRTYLSGTTASTDLPTIRAHQPASGGSLFLNHFPDDGFAASIAADGGSFVYLTYWGGNSADSLRGVAVDTEGNASYVGSTNSPDLLTSHAAQSHLLGGDAFIVRLLPADDAAIALSNAPFTTVEGNQYSGTVAFFSTRGTETADQFSAVIDWGDGLTSAGTIAGDFHSGFQVLGSHFYADVGAHDIFVTLRDSFGRSVTPNSTAADIPGAQGRVRYRVAIDTAELAGVEGLLSFQFNSSASPPSPEAEARISALRLVGGDLVREWERFVSAAPTVDPVGGNGVGKHLQSSPFG